MNEFCIREWSEWSNGSNHNIIQSSTISNHLALFISRPDKRFCKSTEITQITLSRLKIENPCLRSTRWLEPFCQRVAKRLETQMLRCGLCTVWTWGQELLQPVSRLEQPQAFRHCVVDVLVRLVTPHDPTRLCIGCVTCVSSSFLSSCLFSSHILGSRSRGKYNPNNQEVNSMKLHPSVFLTKRCRVPVYHLHLQKRIQR